MVIFHGKLLVYQAGYVLFWDPQSIHSYSVANPCRASLAQYEQIQ